MRTYAFPGFLLLLLLLLLAAPAQAQRPDSVRFVPGGNPALSQLVVAGNTVYLSGVLGMKDGQLVPGGLEPQTHQVMQTIRETLASVGATMDDVVKCLVFMADLDERPRFNPIYASYFPNHRPARSAVGVQLGGEARVEVECVAVLPAR